MEISSPSKKPQGNISIKLHAQQTQHLKLKYGELLTKQKVINSKNLSKLMQMVGFTMNQQEIQIVYNQIDEDQNGTIQESEFLNYMERKKQSIDKEADNNNLFNILSNNSKFIERSVIKSLIKKIDSQMPDYQIQKLLYDLDPKNTGFISKESFLIFIQEGGAK